MLNRSIVIILDKMIFVVRLNLNSEKYVSLSATFQIKIKNGELVLGKNDDTTIMFDVRMLCFIVWLFIATQSTKEVIEPSVFCRQDVSFLSIHCDFNFIFILTLRLYSTYFGKNKKSYLVLITVYFKIAWQQFLFFFYLLYTQLHHQHICPWQIAILVPLSNVVIFILDTLE